MKKSSLLVLLLCVSLLLTACAATDEENLFEMTEGTLVDTTAADTNYTQPDSDETQSTLSNSKEVVSYTGTYPYGNMQIAASRGFILKDNEVVFLHNENGKTRLYAYDLNAEEVRLYCDDATCKHDACVSGDFFSNLEVYEGKLYGMIWPKDYPGIIYYPAVANGNDAEIIIEAAIYRFFHHEDKLYIETADHSLMELEKEQSEPRMVVEALSSVYFVGAGEYMYSQVITSGTNMVVRVHLSDENPEEELLLSNAWGKTDGEHIYYTDMDSSLLYRCDMDGSNPERLLEEKIGGFNFNFDDEYFYYTLYADVRNDPENPNAYDIYRFPKDDPTKIEKIATLPVIIDTIYTVPGTGKIFITNYRTDSSAKAIEYVMNTDGSDLKKLELPEA